MVEFFTTNLGIAIISLLSSLIGATIAVVGNNKIEGQKHKQALQDEAIKAEIECYEQILSSIYFLVRTISDIQNIHLVTALLDKEKITTKVDLGLQIKPQIEELNKIFATAQIKALLYAREDIRDIFIEICKKLHKDPSFATDNLIVNEGVFMHEFDISDIEEKIKTRILELREKQSINK